MSYGKRIDWLIESKRNKEYDNLPSLSNTIVLFDGTLTPPRKELCRKVVQPLENLSLMCEIGILTGSGIEYVRQQLSYLLDKSKIRYKLHLLPCNGTKHYTPPKSADEKHRIKSEKDMKNYLGDKTFHELVKILIQQQAHISDYSIPLTGHFIDYRESMINWCPIGRNANDKERQRFIDRDKSSQTSLRQSYINRIRHGLKMKGLNKKIVCALGGDTSVDIYPTGWDKTYALDHFKDYDVYFVGDRCEENGNDQKIYDALYDKGRSFKTKGPETTCEIIEQTIIPSLIKEITVNTSN